MVAVSLQEVVYAMEALGDDGCAYLNPKTGKIVAIGEEDRMLLEDEDLDEASLPQWQRDSLPKMREALESDDFLVLPSKHDIHEWEIMNRFSLRETNERRREELLNAIHGNGAFRMFKSTIHRFGIQKDWFAFRDAALKEIAKEWLEEHGIPIKPSVGRQSGI
jgi:hypothetical protein